MRKKRSLLLIGTAVIIGVVLFAWWSVFHNRLNEGVYVLNMNRKRVEEIRYILEANPNLCFVSRKHSIDIICPNARTAKDKSDYAQISHLMEGMWVDELNPARDENGRLKAFEFEIFEEGFIRSAPPIMGVWAFNSDGLDALGRHHCKPADISNWYVCPAKWAFL